MSEQGSPGIPVYTDAIMMLKINEFMAANSNFFADEQGECNDWIELVNTGDEEVNIGGLYLTDDLTKPAMYQIPVNFPNETKIKPGEHKILWADAKSGKGPLHLGFKLNASGGAIGLSADGKSVFESGNYSVQSTNVSSGRHLDGTGNWNIFESPTPGYVNSYAPEFTSDPLMWCLQGAVYEYNITTTDGENDELFMGYYTKPYWATFTNTGNGLATITGTMPGGTITKYNIKLFVTDGYSAPVVQEFVLSRGSPPVGIFDESLSANKFNCYPNPTDGLINVEFISTSPVIQLRISNVTGQEVFSKSISGNEGLVSEQIDLSGYKKGIYYLTITADEGTTTQKVILY